MPLPPIISGIPEGLSSLFNEIFRHRDQIRDAVKGIWEKLNDVLNFAADRVRDASTWLFDHIWGGAKAFIGLMNVGAQFLGENFARAWKAVFDALARTAHWVGLKIWKAAMDVIEWTAGKLGDVWEFLTPTFRWIMDWGGALVDLITDFTGHVARVLAGAFLRVADEVGDALDKFIDEHWDD